MKANHVSPFKKVTDNRRGVDDLPVLCILPSFLIFLFGEMQMFENTSGTNCLKTLKKRGFFPKSFL